jgi:hypothetical protein
MDKTNKGKKIPGLYILLEDFQGFTEIKNSQNGKLLLVLPFLMPFLNRVIFVCASSLHIENFSKDVDQEPYFLTQWPFVTCCYSRRTYNALPGIIQ